MSRENKATPVVTFPVMRATLGAGELLLVHPGDAFAALHQKARGSTLPHWVNSATVLIVSRRKATLDTQTDRRIDVIDESALCCLLAFVDPVLAPNLCSVARQDDLRLQSLPTSFSFSQRALEHWLLLQVMKGHDNALLDHLRASESYRIARYLAHTHEGIRHLKAQSRQYGVSYSHFRRLCSRALGGKVKPRLNEWRAARSALALIYREASVLDIALDNGYSCSAHISRDIKKTFGITPSRLMKAHALLP
jgi:AraC-like DNA-binding protein